MYVCAQQDTEYRNKTLKNRIKFLISMILGMNDIFVKTWRLLMRTVCSAHNMNELIKFSKLHKTDIKINLREECKPIRIIWIHLNGIVLLPKMTIQNTHHHRQHYYHIIKYVQRYISCAPNNCCKCCSSLTFFLILRP